ncbi:MAG: hypothetical protein GC160_16860 [Acidobacteria bacterium]|nr:hypothetical protein [Acidobacteriota bacterium]
MTQPNVEWNFIDYGTASFHVASYRRPAEEAAPEAVVEAPAKLEESPCRWSGMLPLFRCWGASSASRRAA